MMGSAAVLSNSFFLPQWKYGITTGIFICLSNNFLPLTCLLSLLFSLYLRGNLRILCCCSWLSERMITNFRGDNPRGIRFTCWSFYYQFSGEILPCVKKKNKRVVNCGLWLLQVSLNWGMKVSSVAPNDLFSSCIQLNPKGTPSLRVPGLPSGDTEQTEYHHDSFSGNILSNTALNTES